MPITRDLPEKLKSSAPGKKAREEDIERRPIITQEKPNTSRNISQREKIKKSLTSKQATNKSNNHDYKERKKSDIHLTVKSSMSSNDAKRKSVEKAQKLSRDKENSKRIRTETRTLDVSEIKFINKSADEIEENYESDFEDDSDESINEQNTTLNSDTDQTVTTLTEMDRKSDNMKFEKKIPTNNDFLKILESKHMEEIKGAIKNESVKKHFNESEQAFGKLNNENFHMDFKNAGKKLNSEKFFSNLQKRAQDILSMIKLDRISYAIFEMPPIPYEVFIKAYGHENRVQVSSQSNEDNCEELIQTDEIVLHDAWTQFPPIFDYQIDSDGKKIYKFSDQERRGCGTESDLVMDSQLYDINMKKLNLFLQRASQKIAVWLDYKNSRGEDNYLPELDFSNKQVKFEVTQSAIVSNVKVSSFRNTILSVVSINHHETILHVWDALQPIAPIRRLICRQNIESVDVSGYFVVAGTSDGSICLWDLRDSMEIQNPCETSGSSPTYTTAVLWQKEGHHREVSSVAFLLKNDDFDNFGFMPMQLCSLDKSGLIIIWSVIQLNNFEKKHPHEDLGLAQWGRVKLVKSSTFSVSDLKRDNTDSLVCSTFNCLRLQGSDGNGIFVACSNGNILHCSTYGVMLQPKKYVHNDLLKGIAGITCIETHPFFENVFLAGYTDGRIRLYNAKRENPLIMLNSDGWENGKSGIVSMKWLPTRPCVFLSLDESGRINLWDLAIWDMYPVKTVATIQPKVTCMDLWMPKSQKLVLVLGIGNSFYMCNLISEYTARTSEELRKEQKHFSRYISIL